MPAHASRWFWVPAPAQVLSEQEEGGGLGSPPPGDGNDGNGFLADVGNIILARMIWVFFYGL